MWQEIFTDLARNKGNVELDVIKKLEIIFQGSSKCTQQSFLNLFLLLVLILSQSYCTSPY